VNPPEATYVATSVEDIEGAAGEEIGVSGWHLVTQEDVDRFARATGDHQWIHVDPQRASASAWGGTIAHGYFTLSLAPRLLAEVFVPEGFGFGLNYGLDRVRFPAPMPVGERLRMRARFLEVQRIVGGVHVKLELTFEREGGAKPVCVAQSLIRYMTPEPS
jgi:acyl dehydratase